MREVGNHQIATIEASLQHIETEREKGGYSVAEICEMKEVPWTLVVRRIAPLKRKIDLHNKPKRIKDLFVSWDVYIWIDFINETNIPAEDWITTTGMADELDVEYKWVNRRLLELDSTGEYRKCSNGSRLHFPPEALEELALIRDQALQGIEYEKYLNLTKMAEIIGRHRLWINNRIDDIEIEPILALDRMGKAVEYYPAEVIDYLIRLRDRYEESGNRLTIPMLADRVSKDREWVEKRLEEIGSVGIYCHFQISGRVDLCFDRKTLYELLSRLEKFEDPEPGWCTENRLRELLGKSSNWTRSKLKQLGAEHKWFQDSKGVARKHYSPKVLINLVIMKKGWVISKNIIISDIDMLDDNSQLKIVVDYGKTMSHNTLMGLGVTELDILSWMEHGFLTRWKDGQYYVTRKAEDATKILQIE